VPKPTSPSLPEFKAIFFNPEVIWLTPSDLVRFQIQKKFWEETKGDLTKTFPRHLKPRLMTIGALERQLTLEIEPPEIDDLHYQFYLNDLVKPLLHLLWPSLLNENDNLETTLKIKADLAAELGDGLSRLKLAGLSWDQVATLPPEPLTRTLADLGRRQEAWLKSQNNLDRSGKRRQLLESLGKGFIFKTLLGVKKIVYPQAQRLSPFETDFLLALSRDRQVDVTLQIPTWMRNEEIGFDFLRTIKYLKTTAKAPNLNLFFSDTTAAPPALAYAAEALLDPIIRRRLPPPDPTGQLVIMQTATTYQEVEEAARHLKKLLAQGRRPENMALVVPSLKDYSPLIKDIGRRFGLAFYYQRGEMLVEQGPVRAILELLAVWTSNWERSRLLDLILNPYFTLTNHFQAPTILNQLTLEAGITDRRAGGGFEENLTKLANLIQDRDQSKAQDVKILLTLITQLKKAGDSLISTSTWPDFIDRFKTILNEFGWPGARNPNLPPLVLKTDTEAAEVLAEELNHLSAALNTSPAPKLSLSCFRLWLKTVLSKRHINNNSIPEGRLQVLNYYDLNGAIFDEIFFLGLNEGVFPRICSENRWWPEEFIRATAVKDFLGRAPWNSMADRYRQEELLLAAGLSQARQRVWLFHHSKDKNGRPALPSPLLEALRELWPQGNGDSMVTKENAISQPTPHPIEAVSHDELWVGLAQIEPAHWPANVPKSNENLDLWRQLRRRHERIHNFKTEAHPGPAAISTWLQKRPLYQGQPLIRPAFLANFEKCPLAFWFKEALGLRGESEPLEEWSVNDEGNLFHQVLEKFFTRRLGKLKNNREREPGHLWPGKTSFKKSHQELLLLLSEEINSCRHSPLGRLPLWEIRQNFLHWVLTDWLQRELTKSSEDVRPWYVEWSFGASNSDAAPPLKIFINETESIYFHGRLDRLDRTDRGLWVRDYKRSDNLKEFKTDEKSGRFPLSSWSLLIYALAAEKTFKLPAKCSFEILIPTTKINQWSGPATNSPEMDLDPQTRADRAREGLISFPNLLAETWEQIKKGIFPPRVRERNSCRFCAFTLMCSSAANDPEENKT